MERNGGGGVPPPTGGGRRPEHPDDTKPRIIVSPDALTPSRPDTTEKMPMPWDGADRRAFPRKHAKVRATMRGLEAKGQGFVEVELFDLSEGGLYAVTDEAPNFGAHLEFRLQLPDTPSVVAIQAKVVRVVLPAAASPHEPAGFAVQITHSSGLQILQAYLRSLPHAPGK
jgi:Tfp pilus assembly protein PilZ